MSTSQHNTGWAWGKVWRGVGVAGRGGCGRKGWVWQEGPIPSHSSQYKPPPGLLASCTDQMMSSIWQQLYFWNNL